MCMKKNTRDRFEKEQEESKVPEGKGTEPLLVLLEGFIVEGNCTRIWPLCWNNNHARTLETYNGRERKEVGSIHAASYYQAFIQFK